MIANLEKLILKQTTPTGFLSVIYVLGGDFYNRFTH
mgnify:CR=1 FL=1